MAVYVDNMYKYPMGRYKGMRMSHLIADTTEELLNFVVKIGVNVKWIQHPGTNLEHFDICFSKRKLAILHGAEEITYRELGEMCHKRKKLTEDAST